MARKTIEARLTELRTDVDALRAQVGDETPVPVGDGGGTSTVDLGPVNARIDGIDQRLRTLEANQVDPNAAAEREAQATARVVTVERVLLHVLDALGDTYDGEADDRAALAQNQPA